MANYHLMHCIPNHKMHGLNGYIEVIKSVEWGLSQLGHSVSYAINQADKHATNIIFGAQVLPIDFLKGLPNTSIIYNFEQMRGLKKNEVRPEVQYFADKFQIWDYSTANESTWKMLAAERLKIVPVGYAPPLTRIPKPHIQDIDVLIYGLSGPKRLTAFHHLNQAGLRVMFVSGFYGDARDELIARSKIILNINLYDFAQIFEIVRVSYLFANKKAVVATLDASTFIEADFINSMKFSSIKKIVEDCIQLLEDDNERINLEEKGFESFSNRGICEILQNALDA